MRNEMVMTMPFGAQYVANDECEYVDGLGFWDWVKNIIGTIAVGATTIGGAGLVVAKQAKTTKIKGIGLGMFAVGGIVNIFLLTLIGEN